MTFSSFSIDLQVALAAALEILMTFSTFSSDLQVALVTDAPGIFVMTHL